VDRTYFKKLEGSHEDIHEEKDLHGDENQPNEELNMFPKMERELRKRFKTCCFENTLDNIFKEEAQKLKT